MKFSGYKQYEIWLVQNDKEEYGADNQGWKTPEDQNMQFDADVIYMAKTNEFVSL